MKKITIATYFEIEESDSESNSLKARTTVAFDNISELKSVLEIHEEKVGAIERKILKEYENTVDTI